MFHARAARSIRAESDLGSAAIKSRSRLVSVGSFSSRRRTSSRSPSPIGSSSGKAASPRRWSAVSSRGMWSSPVGFPWVASMTRSRTSRRMSGYSRSSSARAVDLGNPLRVICGTSSNGGPADHGGSVTAQTIATGTPVSRRAAKAIAAADSSSRRSASSTQQRRGRVLATRETSDRTLVPTVSSASPDPPVVGNFPTDPPVASRSWRIRVRDLCLGLEPANRDRGHALCVRRRPSEDGRLPDPRLSANDQPSALRSTRRLEQAVEKPALSNTVEDGMRRRHSGCQ